ncbi:MAG: DUF6133 family protein [Oscillospiraceae bacterium]
MKLFNTIKNKIASFAIKTQVAIANKRAEGFVDSGVKILIAVVIGALLLGGLYLLFNTTILPTLTTKIQALFNYTGK